jgi:hypothetical protein
VFLCHDIIVSQRGQESCFAMNSFPALFFISWCYRKGVG